MLRVYVCLEYCATAHCAKDVAELKSNNTHASLRSVRRRCVPMVGRGLDSLDGELSGLRHAFRTARVDLCLTFCRGINRLIGVI